MITTTKGSALQVYQPERRGDEPSFLPILIIVHIVQNSINVGPQRVMRRKQAQALWKGLGD